MGFLHVAATFGIVIALFGAPVRCQSSSDSNMPTWKLVAIIVPSVVGGLTLLSCLYFCCCYRRSAGSRGLCGDCGDCGNCGDCGDCGHCGARCCDCGDCCYGGSRPHVTQHAVYSSAQGPITVQDAYNYRSAPPPQGGYYKSENTYGSSFPVSGGGYGGAVYGEPPRGSYGGGVRY